MEKIQRIQDQYWKLNFPREIQASKLDESSATKLPWGNLVWQSGQGEHSPEGNLTEGLCARGPEYRSQYPVGSFCCTSQFWICTARCSHSTGGGAFELSGGPFDVE